MFKCSNFLVNLSSALAVFDDVNPSKFGFCWILKVEIDNVYCIVVKLWNVGMYIFIESPCSLSS